MSVRSSLPTILLLVNVLLSILCLFAALIYNWESRTGPVDLANIITELPAFQGCVIFMIAAILIHILQFVYSSKNLYLFLSLSLCSYS